MSDEVSEETGEEVVPAPKKKERKQRRNPFSPMVRFLREVIAELKKVVTPTRKELFSYTGVVLVFVIILMAIVYGLDQLFGWVVLLVFGNPS